MRFLFVFSCSKVTRGGNLWFKKTTQSEAIPVKNGAASINVPFTSADSSQCPNAPGSLFRDAGGKVAGSLPSEWLGALPIWNSIVPPLTISAWRNQI